MTAMALFFLVLFNNYIIINYFFVPTFYEKIGSSFFYLYLFMFVISLILFFILPKRNANLLRMVRKNKFAKWLVTIYLVLSSSYLILITSLSLGYNFYQNYSPLIFILALIMAVILIMRFRIEKIVNSALIFFLILFVMIIYTLACDLVLIDFSEIKLIGFNKEMFLGLPLMLILILDNYILALIRLKEEKSSFKVIVLANMFLFFFASVEGLMLVLFFGDTLRGFKGIGYLLYNLNPTFFVLENFDFLYIYSLTLSALFKVLVSFKLIESCHIEKKTFGKFFLITSTLALSLLTYFFGVYLFQYQVYFLYLLLFILVIYFITLWRIACDKHQRNNRSIKNE